MLCFQRVFIIIFYFFLCIKIYWKRFHFLNFKLECLLLGVFERIDTAKSIIFSHVFFHYLSGDGWIVFHFSKYMREWITFPNRRMNILPTLNFHSGWILNIHHCRNSLARYFTIWFSYMQWIGAFSNLFLEFAWIKFYQVYRLSWNQSLFNRSTVQNEPSPFVLFDHTLYFVPMLCTRYLW